MFRFILIASAVIACAYAGLLSDASATGSSSSDIQPDGYYKYNWETSNGIAAQEQGLGGVAVSGSYSYYSPEGKLVQTGYVADENGFQPQGDHLPTPPPTPLPILKALEYIRLHAPVEEPRLLRAKSVKNIFG